MADDEQYESPTTEPYYGGEANIAKSALSLGSMRQPPIRKIVEQQILELEKQLTERKAFLEDLSKVPDVEKLLDRMRKLHI